MENTLLNSVSNKLVKKSLKEEIKKENIVSVQKETKEKVYLSIFIVGVIGIIFSVITILGINNTRKKFFNLGRSLERQAFLRLYSNEVSKKVTVDVVESRSWESTILAWMAMRESYWGLDIRTPSERIKYNLENKVKTKGDQSHSEENDI